MDKEKIFLIVAFLSIMIIILFHTGNIVETREVIIKDKTNHISSLNTIISQQIQKINDLEEKNAILKAEKENLLQEYNFYVEENNIFKEDIKTLTQENGILKNEKYITDKLNELNAVEWNALYRVARAEAGPDSKEAIKNVVYVILNRMYSNRFREDTIMEVIFAKGQFAGTQVNKFWTYEITDEVIQNVQEAYLDYNPEIGEYCAQGALFFHQNEWSETFCNAKYIFTDEIGHHFYKYEKKR